MLTRTVPLNHAPKHPTNHPYNSYDLHTLHNNNISQEVCEHFQIEGILKIMNLLKQLVSSRVPAGVGSHQLLKEHWFPSTSFLALLPSFCR